MKLNKLFRLLIVSLMLTVSVSAEETVNVNIRDMGVKDFVTMVGKILKKNVLINGDLKGKINFVATEPIKTSSLMSLANSILASKGYVLVDKGDFMEVVKASEAAGQGLDVSENISGGTMKTVLFPLKTSNAAVIRAKIRPLLHKNAKVVSFKNNNVLAVTAYPRTLKSIKKLIDSIESSGKKGSTIVRLKNASAKDIYTNASGMAKKLFPQTIPSERVDIFKDEATNSIILVGKRDNVSRMVEYIKELDQPGQSVAQKMYVIPLKNSNVEDMEKILSKLVAQMNNMATTGAKKGKKVKKAMVVGDAERNALIVLATGDQIKNIREVVNRIDVEKPQVYIVARIVEIDINKAQKIGVDWGSSRSFKGAVGDLAKPETRAALRMIGQEPIVKKVMSFMPMGTSTLLKFFALGAKIDYLKQNGAAEVLSEPSVLCTNNKESEIYVGQVRSILTSSVAGDNKDDQARNQYSREDIGIRLKVKPRLSSNNKVALEVEANIEDVDPSDKSALPTTTKRKVVTNAIVSNGQTIILGGLMKDSSGSAVRKVPILGDIPILGLLFKTTDDEVRKINVVIYLTPYIVRKSSDLVKLKEFLSELNSIQARYNALLMKRLGKKPNSRKQTNTTSPKRHRNSAMEILQTGRMEDGLDRDGGGNY